MCPEHSTPNQNRQASDLTNPASHTIHLALHQPNGPDGCELISIGGTERSAHANARRALVDHWEHEDDTDGEPSVEVLLEDFRDPIKVVSVSGDLPDLFSVLGRYGLSVDQAREQLSAALDIAMPQPGTVFLAYAGTFITGVGATREAADLSARLTDLMSTARDGQTTEADFDRVEGYKILQLTLGAGDDASDFEEFILGNGEHVCGLEEVFRAAVAGETPPEPHVLHRMTTVARPRLHKLLSSGRLAPDIRRQVVAMLQRPAFSDFDQAAYDLKAAELARLATGGVFL